jgi:hypothetical protein
MAAEISLGGGYSIDLDDAQKFIDTLKDQVKWLIETQASARSDLKVVPPGHDDYSAAWASSANEMVQAHDKWNQGKQTELNTLIDNITKAVAKYKQTEHDNTMRA